MISVDIYAFALVLSAAACVALAWIIFDTRKRLRAASSSAGMNTKILVQRCDALEKRLTASEKLSPVALGAQVVELSEAVERLRKTQQRFAGRVDQALSDRARGHDDVEPEPSDNPTYNALLRAQNTNPFQR